MMRPDGAARHSWRNDDVKAALDLCLACKGCKGDCPVNVDMATYKAEFLAHYYRGRLRPPSAYAMGLIPVFAPLASPFPDLINALTSAPLVSHALKLAAGIALERHLPKFATVPFDRWYATYRERHAPPKGTRVVLWADTFNTYFTPEVAVAALEALEELGYAVETPQRRVCCGRPFYDYGFLSLAQSYLRDALATLEPYLRDGTPIIGLEPSCIAVFRDELLQMFPNDVDAQRLAKQTYTLAEFLELRGGHWNWRVPRLQRKAIVQLHCHHQAVMQFDSEMAALQKLGLEVDKPDSGCCGMAGSFGYEAGERYRVSQACGERVILPKVREASDDTLVLADGFSCRHQIEGGAGKTPLHFAQLLHLAQMQRTGKHSRNGVAAGGAARATRLRELALGAGLAAVAGLGVAVTAQRRKGNGHS
jgi:Fe-S oxidoreductase